MSNGLGIPSGTATTWLIPDMNSAVDVLELSNASLYRMGIEPSLGNNNEVEEDDLGAYLQGDFNFELGGRTLRGNIGVRYVQTDQTSTGFSIATGNANSTVLTTVEREYDDTLPIAEPRRGPHRRIPGASRRRESDDATESRQPDSWRHRQRLR